MKTLVRTFCIDEPIKKSPLHPGFQDGKDSWCHLNLWGYTPNSFTDNGVSPPDHCLPRTPELLTFSALPLPRINRQLSVYRESLNHFWMIKEKVLDSINVS